MGKPTKRISPRNRSECLNDGINAYQHGVNHKGIEGLGFGSTEGLLDFGKGVLNPTGMGVTMGDRSGE